MTVRAPANAPPLVHEVTREARAQPASQRGVYWHEPAARIDTPIYDGRTLTPGAFLEGPGVVEYPNTTIAVRPGQHLCSDAFGNLVLDLFPEDADEPRSGAGGAR